MGSVIEINDTLQITTEQGFPNELNYSKHKVTPYKAEDFVGRVFTFKDKPKIRTYQQPPVRNFLVQNVDGKWLYWGLVHIIETTHDNINRTTSGKFKIIYIYTPEEMEQTHRLIDQDKSTDYFDRK